MFHSGKVLLRYNVIKHEYSYHEASLISKPITQDDEFVQGILQAGVGTQFDFQMTGGNGNAAWQQVQVARGSVRR